MIAPAEEFEWLLVLMCAALQDSTDAQCYFGTYELDCDAYSPRFLGANNASGIVECEVYNRTVVGRPVYTFFCPVTVRWMAERRNLSACWAWSGGSGVKARAEWCACPLLLLAPAH